MFTRLAPARSQISSIIFASTTCGITPDLIDARSGEVGEISGAVATPQKAGAELVSSRPLPTTSSGEVNWLGAVPLASGKFLGLSHFNLMSGSRIFRSPARRIP
jgi:hypothetical protein